MILRIPTISDFGIFADWRWDSGAVSDFKKYNVLYGWNYSGKTTLSRVFRMFELRARHADYPDAQASIRTPEGDYHSGDFNHPLAIKVFNEDFVAANIRWEDTIEPVLMLGEENIELQEHLSQKREDRRSKQEELTETKKRIQAQRQSLEEGLTSKAREIKNGLSLPDYDRPKLQSLIDSSDPKDLVVIDHEELQRHLDRYRSTNRLPKLKRVPSHTTMLPSVVEQSKGVLQTVVTASVIQELKEDPELSSWVEKGMELHQGRNHCRFCTGTLPPDLLKRLGQHFSDAYDKHIQSIDTLLATISRSKVDASLHAPAELYGEYQADYVKRGHRLLVRADDFNAELNKIAESLESKKESPFDEVPAPSIATDIDINVDIDSLNSIIDKHNARTEQFKAGKAESREALLQHHAAEAVRDLSYFEVTHSIEQLRRELERQQNDEKVLRADLLDLEARLSDTVKGAETINRHLESLLGRDDLRIDVTEDNKFQLIRRGCKASNLSSGEKTAISFAYFMTKLSERDAHLPETIIFIDDPVSSLDANHLFKIYARLRSIADCRQLFIATHNFELLNLFKRWLREKKYKKNACFYLVQRTTGARGDCASIVKMPEVLLKFESEYHYLFSLLHEFNSEPTTDYQSLYVLPNLARRFLEAFLSFKVPRNMRFRGKLRYMFKDDVEKEQVLKFVHEYSHQISLARSLHFPDLSECKQVVDLILTKARELDPEHFEALLEEMNGVCDVQQDAPSGAS